MNNNLYHKISILGAGESGVGAALLAKSLNATVYLSDNGLINDKYKSILNENKIDWEEKNHDLVNILESDLVIKSPGIPDTISLIKSIKEKNIPVISEIEFAYNYSKGNCIAITGSNGKTTTALLTHYLIKDDLNTALVGNIGDSFAKQVVENDADNYVIEVSSFQLDGIEKFKPSIAILTNITPDHLDRYDYKFENYIKSKFRITKNQTKEDVLIYDADDEVIVEFINNNKIKATLHPFSLTREYTTNGTYIKHNILNIKLNKTEIKMAISNFSLQGQHNAKNIMAAATAAHMLKVRKENIRKRLQTFKNISHRLEKVKKVNDVWYINDSKATNVNSVYYALDSMVSDLVWIVGGADKGNDYSEIMPLVKSKVRAIICLGIDNQKLVDTFSSEVEMITETKSMYEAVAMAKEIAVKGETVLLSPACASFDLFQNYEDRGNQFKQFVNAL